VPPLAGATIPAVVVQDLPDWERLLAAERHVQSLVPGAVLGRLEGVMTGIRQLWSVPLPRDEGVA
jgi:hypothetical protein